MASLDCGRENGWFVTRRPSAVGMQSPVHAMPGKDAIAFLWTTLAGSRQRGMPHMSGVDGKHEPVDMMSQFRDPAADLTQGVLADDNVSWGVGVDDMQHAQGVDHHRSG